LTTDCLLDQLDKQLDTLTPAQLKLMLQEMSTLDGPLTSLASTSLADFNLVNLTHDKIQKPVLHLFGYFYSADYSVYHARAVDAEAE
jgi:hypothetical protein